MRGSLQARVERLERLLGIGSDDDDDDVLADLPCLRGLSEKRTPGHPLPTFMAHVWLHVVINVSDPDADPPPPDGLLADPVVAGAIERAINHASGQSWPSLRDRGIAAASQAGTYLDKLYRAGRLPELTAAVKAYESHQREIESIIRERRS